MGTKSESTLLGLGFTLLCLGLGQFFSLLSTSTGYICSQLAKKGVDAPFSLCLLFYLLLAFVYGGIMIYKGQPHKGQPLKAKPYYYTMLALFDVFGKFFLIKGYHHTSLTSAMLLDHWTIPFFLGFAWLFKKRNPGFKKLVGWTICVSGLVAIVLYDVHSADRSSGINPLRGDLLIIVGATFHGVANIIEAVFLKTPDIVERNTFLGIYGAILIASQIVINERNELKSILSSPVTMFLFIGLSLATFLCYSGYPRLVKISGPRMPSLSLLSSALIQIFVFHEKVDWIYFVCFAVVTLGIILIINFRKCSRDPSNGEPARIDEPLLHKSDNDEISNNDESSTSFQGPRNLLCNISCIVKIQIQEGDVKSSMVILQFASKSGEWIV